MKVYILTLNIKHEGFEILYVYSSKGEADEMKTHLEETLRIPSDGWIDVVEYEVQ